MSQKKITDLQLRSAVIDTVNVPVDDGTQSYRTTAAQWFDYLRSKFATVRSISAAGQTLAAANVMILLDPTSASFTQAFPAVASLGVGTTWIFKHVGSANTVTLDPNGAELIDQASTLVLEPGDAVKLFNTGTKWITLESNLTVRRSRIITAERIPTGAIFPFAGSSAPTGWLLCDGSLLSRTTYSDLFAAISTNHGVGDGSTTFGIPDTRGLFLRGVGSQVVAGKTVSTTLGAKQGMLTALSQVTGMYTDYQGTHSHRVLAQNAGGQYWATGFGANEAYRFAGVYGSYNGQNYWWSAQNGGGDAETRPANYGVNHIIKF